ncbi:MAG: hypothetical protein ABIV06_01330, partial [Thermoanaerobaculia bacterium]
MTRRFSALALLAAMLVPAVLYLPTLGFGFLFDDRPLLIDNPVVQAPAGLTELFTSDLDPRSRLSDAPTTNYLRPLFLALASGLYRLCGDRPAGWHAAALLLHALLGGLAFLVLRREGLAEPTSLAAALLFSLHPAHVHSAAWISGLQDLLFAVLVLVAFLAYRASQSRPQAGAGPLSALGVAYLLALLAKEPAVGLLIFALAETACTELLARRRKTAIPRRTPRAELLTLGVVTSGYFVYRAAVLGTLAHSFPTAPALPLALASVPVAILAYLRDLLWPVGLFLLHPARPVAAVFSAPSAGAALGVVGVVAALLYGLRRRPNLGLPVLWSLAWLAPVLALWTLNPEWMVMDRYLLLPTLGLAWGVALLLPLEGGRSSIDLWRGMVWAGLLIAFAGLSAAGMQTFASEERFWSTAVRSDPGSSTAWAEWARLRADAGDLAGAASALERATELDPRALLPRHRRAL